MKSQRRIVWLMVGLVAAIAGSGCATLDEKRQLERDNLTLRGEKAQLEQELQDLRTSTEGVRSQVGSYEDRLRDRDSVIANLRAENGSLKNAFEKCQSTLETLAGRQMPSDIKIIERRLPPELDNALRDFAAQHPGAVEYDPQRGIVKWKSDLLFALGSDAVKDSAVQALRDFAGIMASSAGNGFDILVVGHTDDRPIVRSATKEQHPTNWHLSAHRAISVSNALQSAGIGPTRIGVMGFGEYRPIDTNATEAGRARNRRVEIYVVPAGSVGGVTPNGGQAAQSQQPEMDVYSSPADAGLDMDTK